MDIENIVTEIIEYKDNKATLTIESNTIHCFLDGFLVNCVITIISDVYTNTISTGYTDIDDDNLLNLYKSLLTKWFEVEVEKKINKSKFKI